MVVPVTGAPKKFSRGAVPRSCGKGSGAAGEDLGEHGGEVGAVLVAEVRHQVAVDALDVRGDGAVEDVAALGREDDVDAAAVVGAGLALDEAGLDHAVHESGDAARGQCDVVAEAAHGDPAVGRGADVDQHVEEDERDPDVLLELPAEAVGEEAVRADDEAHEVEALVVYLAEDATGVAGAGRGWGVEALVLAALAYCRACRHYVSSLSRNPPSLLPFSWDSP